MHCCFQCNSGLCLIVIATHIFSPIKLTHDYRNIGSLPSYVLGHHGQSNCYSRRVEESLNSSESFPMQRRLVRGNTVQIYKTTVSDMTYQSAGNEFDNLWVTNLTVREIRFIIQSSASPEHQCANSPQQRAWQFWCYSMDRSMADSKLQPLLIFKLWHSDTLVGILAAKFHELPSAKQCRVQQKSRWLNHGNVKLDLLTKSDVKGIDNSQDNYNGDLLWCGVNRTRMRAIFTRLFLWILTLVTLTLSRYMRFSLNSKCCQLPLMTFGIGEK